MTQIFNWSLRCASMFEQKHPVRGIHLIYFIMSKNIVSIKNLSHRYSKEWAVKDVSFSIQGNGTIGLLGSNGAGKSTTMNILCGIITPTQGEITVNDIDFKRNPIEGKKNIGFLPQKAPLYLDLTVDEY